MHLEITLVTYRLPHLSSSPRAALSLLLLTRFAACASWIAGTAIIPAINTNTGAAIATKNIAALFLCVFIFFHESKRDSFFLSFFMKRQEKNNDISWKREISFAYILSWRCCSCRCCACWRVCDEEEEKQVLDIQYYGSVLVLLSDGTKAHGSLYDQARARLSVWECNHLLHANIRWRRGVVRAIVQCPEANYRCREGNRLLDQDSVLTRQYQCAHHKNTPINRDFRCKRRKHIVEYPVPFLFFEKWWNSDVIGLLKKCPACNAEVDVEMLNTYNESLAGFKKKGLKLKCPNCEVASLKGLWERVR